MIADIIKWTIYGVAALYTIYFQFVRISSKWRCRKKHYLKPANTCHEDGCKFAKCCGEYEYLLSEEEAEMLEKLISELRRKN